MTKEDREILVRDLCARLPYNTVISVTNDDRNTIQYLVEEDIKDLRSTILYSGNTYKPYLFPLSSMTEEQQKEYEKMLLFTRIIFSSSWDFSKTFDDEYVIPYWFVDFCNKHHLDYRGLIPKGLALDATGLNIY